MTDTKPIERRLQRSRARLLEAAGGIAAGQWQQRPGAGRWSAAEVLSHLTTVEGKIQEGLTTLLASDPKPVPFWRRLHIPPMLSEYRVMKRETPLALDTSLLGEKEAMLEAYAEVRTRTLEILRANATRDLRRWRWPHPFFGSINGKDWLVVIASHEVRHSKQLQEIARDLR